MFSASAGAKEVPMRENSSRSRHETMSASQTVQSMLRIMICHQR